MSYYPLEIEENHLIARLSPGPWIIDTGSPGSFSSTCPQLPIGEYLHQIPSEFNGLTEQKLREYTNASCIGLIGNDILSKHHVCFRSRSAKKGSGSISFTNDTPETPQGAVHVPLDLSDGYPIGVAKVNGAGEIPVLFDTGAQISYLADRDWLTGAPIDRVNDFMHGIGRFEADVYVATVTLGSITASLKFAHHPKVSSALKRIKARGIIGWEILKHGPALYSLANRELWI
jgi:hypothetical protein